MVRMYKIITEQMLFPLDGHKMFGIYKSLGQTCNPFKLNKFGKDCTWKLEINSKFTFTVA